MNNLNNSSTNTTNNNANSNAAVNNSNNTNGTNSQTSNINGMGLLNSNNFPNSGNMTNLPNIHNFQNVPNYQNIKNGLKNQRNNISVFQRMPGININGKVNASSTTPSAVLPSIATTLPLKGNKDNMTLPVTTSQLINGIDMNNSPTAKINTMLFNDVTANYNNAVMNQNNYIQNSTSQLLGVNNTTNTNKVNEKSVLFTGRYDDIMGQDQNSLFGLTLGSSGKSSPCSSIGSPISSPSYSPTISANGFLSNDSPVGSIKSLSLNQPSYITQGKSSYTTNFGPSIWSTASTSSMSDIGSSNLPDYNPKMTGNAFTNIMSSSNALNELDLQSKAITPPMSSSAINERGIDKDISSVSSGIIGGNRSILENGRTTRSKSESFALQGIINDINNAVYSSEIGRKKSTASSIYDEIIGNDLMEPMSKPLSLSSNSPKNIKPLNKHTIIEENIESEKTEGKNNEDNTQKEKKAEEITKSTDFGNIFSNTVTATTDSVTQKLDDYNQISSSPSTNVSDANKIALNDGKKLETESTVNAKTKESSDAKSENDKLDNTDRYEKSPAYLQLESQCNQFKSVVDNLIAKLLSLQKENDILLSDKQELLQYKKQSKQEIEELKLENSLLKNELKLKNITVANNTNSNHALKENIQNENSYMMNNF